MSEEADATSLIEARALRKSARALLDDDVKLLKRGLADRPIGRRIRDRAVDGLVDTVDQAREIASENKVIIAGTGALLLGWFARRPIIRGIEAGVRRLKDLTKT